LTGKIAAFYFFHDLGVVEMESLSEKTFQPDEVTGRGETVNGFFTVRVTRVNFGNPTGDVKESLTGIFFLENHVTFVEDCQGRWHFSLFQEFHPHLREFNLSLKMS
jgi:hypothetical protein